MTKPYRRETKFYPSFVSTKTTALLQDNTEKIELSKRFTVAPAYNKGAYQVISSEDIKDIGK